MKSKQNAEIEQLSFEEAIAELESIVRRLEVGDEKLEEAISAYERGALLQRHCETRLQDAKMRIEKISISDDGKIESQSFQNDDIE